jgi:hypothetical protein
VVWAEDAEAAAPESGCKPRRQPWKLGDHGSMRQDRGFALQGDEIVP